ncbi:MAG TPA: DUF4861 domain-containing protein [Bacteroidales bacterium]|nr:DUF4861 domain-containing protein [Bacteroidales bacterium]
MKKNLKRIIGVSGAFLIILGTISCSNQGQLQIKVENTDNQPYTDDPVVIKRTDLQDKLKITNDGQSVLVVNFKGDTIPSQVDDTNGDGHWDELFFLSDFDSIQSKTFFLSVVPEKEMPEFTQRTNVRFASIYDNKFVPQDTATRIKGTDTEVTQQYFQVEGPAWENDKVGFRNYFDERNGFDIFGKRTTEMVMNMVGTGKSYHELQPWGMDILKVGNSLGAGGIAIDYKDSLYNFAPGAVGTYQLLSAGPLRSVFKLSFTNIHIGDQTMALDQVISIIAGEYGYHSKVTVTGFKDSISLAAGIVNMHSDTLYFTDNNDKFVSIATHDKQAFLGEYLGMGLIFNKKDFVKYGETPDTGTGIIQTYYGDLQLSGEEPVDFMFMTGWEYTDKQFANREYFLTTIAKQAAKMAHPVKVSFE